MNIKHMTTQLIDKHGFTQKSLADKVTEMGARCTQPTIWRIINTDVDPAYSVGDAIRRLYVSLEEQVA